MGISRATYYHQPIREEKQKVRDMELRGLIEEIHLELPGYGYRRIREHLLRLGIRVNNKRIRRIMKLYSLFSCIKKLCRPKGAAIGLRLYYPNLIRGLKLNAPNQLWCTDITYIKLLNEYIYLSAVIDVYTRKIVGWAVSRELSHKFCLESIGIAVRRENPPADIIHHSDRGTQYTCEDYVKILLENKFKISMSRGGTPEDNAYIESFFKTLKREEVFFKNYQTIKDVIKYLPKFIDDVYNTKRLHSSLGYKPPCEFEEEIQRINPADRPVQKLWGYAV